MMKLKNREVKYVQFYNDAKKQLFEVRTTAEDVTKDDLLAIAENLK